MKYYQKEDFGGFAIEMHSEEQIMYKYNVAKMWHLKLWDIC